MKKPPYQKAAQRKHPLHIDFRDHSGGAVGVNMYVVNMYIFNGMTDLQCGHPGCIQVIAFHKGAGGFPEFGTTFWIFTKEILKESHHCGWPSQKCFAIFLRRGNFFAAAR